MVSTELETDRVHAHGRVTFISRIVDRFMSGRHCYKINAFFLLAVRKLGTIVACAG